MNALTIHKNKQIALLIAPNAAQTLMLELVGKLAIEGPVHVLDGGNQLNVYRVARTIRLYTEHLSHALKNISIVRAFTCYQMAAALNQTRMPPGPILVLDMLSTFYDENVHLIESKRLLNACLKDMHRISASTSIAVSARPPLAAQRDRLALLEILRQSANQFWEVQESSANYREKRHGKNITVNHPGLPGGTGDI